MDQSEQADYRYAEILRKISYGPHIDPHQTYECPACIAREAITPPLQAQPAPWYVCTRCGLFYQSIYGCGCPVEKRLSRKGSK